MIECREGEKSDGEGDCRYTAGDAGDGGLIVSLPSFCVVFLQSLRVFPNLFGTVMLDSLIKRSGKGFNLQVSTTAGSY
jgi:hypothetical protein